MLNLHRVVSYLAASLVPLVTIGHAHADVTLPRIFGDHMVLQQESTLPVWGWASPGEKVTVTLGSQTQSTVATADGKWRVDLKSVPPTKAAQELRITGNNTLNFTDVLVGDVWIASGQSNMERGIQSAHDADISLPKANDSQLRMYFVPWATALEPQKDLAAAPLNSLNGRWVVCTPENMKANWGWYGFSAIGYYFAKDLREKTGRPIGMIATYKGGTPAQAWTSMNALESQPQFEPYTSDHKKLINGFEAAKAAFPAKENAAKAAIEKWNAAGQKGPRPQGAPAPDGGHSAPANNFNAMVAPLIPYAIKGVIWYQGESNANTIIDSLQYRDLFPLMITDWRQQWGQGDFPFLFVELAGYNAKGSSPYWPWLRDSQQKALALPNTGLATAIDIGDANDIHPKDKTDVGHRLALVARKIAYGESNLVTSGPTYTGMKTEGSKIRLSFSNTGSGLTIGSAPWVAEKSQPIPTNKLLGFLIAGADKNFVEADATFEGNTVIVSSPSVSQPVAVRYAWSDCPAANLYNAEKLPASPFRTDSFEPGPIQNLALKPFPPGGDMFSHFKKNVELARGKSVDLIFDGDSITDWFATKGKDVWTKYYGSRRVANFAIAGDQTGQLLYRLQNGQVDGFYPKLVVLLIGTNNTIRDSSEQTAQGIQACVAEYQKRCPNAHILLLKLFPRRPATDPMRARVNDINKQIDKIDWGSHVTVLEFGHLFMDANQTINTDLLPDRLHPSPAGYEVWANALEPTISKYVPAEPQP